MKKTKDCSRFRRDACRQNLCKNYLTCEIQWGGTFPGTKEDDYDKEDYE